VLPAGVDSLTARQQLVEQWIRSELLLREAEARGLRDRPDVQRQIEENERAVLAAVVLESLYDDAQATPSHADLERYMEQNATRMYLREPYVRVRYINASSAANAEAARRALQTATTDSLWHEVALRYAADTTAALSLASSYFAESRLAQSRGIHWQMLPQMQPRQISPVLSADSTYHVFQLVERIPAGTMPRLEWVEDDLRQQVLIQTRKQVIARAVHRLKSEAQARNLIETR
jgi:hypothetical protein